MAATSLHPIIHTGTNPYIHKSIQVHLLSQIHADGGVFECCMRWPSQLTTHLVNTGSRWERTEESSADHLVWVWLLLLHKQWTGGEGREGSGAGLEGENQRREGRGAALALLRWRGEERMGGVVEGRAGVECDMAGKESAGMWLHRRRVRWVARVWGAIYMWGGDGDGLGWPVNRAAY